MDKTEKFLCALDPPDPAKASRFKHCWPEGIPSIPEPKQEHALEYQFLADDSIGDYLRSIAGPPAGKLNGATRHRPFPIDFAALNQSWKADRYPLALCEFLAYKSGLAYRSPRHIQHDLLGLDSKGRRYKEGIDQFAFFDTSRPESSVRYTDTQAYAFVHENTGFLIFRGTTSLSDWFTNLSGELTTKSFDELAALPRKLVGSPEPARHTGFAIAWGSVAPDMMLWVQDQLDHRRIDKIVLSGHSLGGALAILGAHHFASHRICPVHAVVTFGAPKVGGTEFQTAYESPNLGLKDRTLRIEATGDVVTRLYSHGCDQHVGHPWPLKKRPLRPAWQMVLFSPLIDAERAAVKKIEDMDESRGREAKAAKSGRAKAQAARPTRETGADDKATRTWKMFFLELALRAFWYVAKSLVRALAAHSVESRYGLYISTLSYRRIRKYHSDQARLKIMLRPGQENPRIIHEGAFVAANEDLARHLHIVRGRHPKTFRYLARRPIRLETPEKLTEYEKKYVNYIA